jgi:poly [ADP-ribose] polymerase 7/11/12/13
MDATTVTITTPKSSTYKKTSGAAIGANVGVLVLFGITGLTWCFFRKRTSGSHYPSVVVDNDDDDDVDDALLAVTNPMFDPLSDREHWMSTGQKGHNASKLFLVHPRTEEYNAVTQLFLATMPGKTVDRLERVENGLMHEVFKMTEAAIRKQVNGLTKPVRGAGAASDKLVRRLFHGTSAVEAIVNSTDGHGFLPLLAGTSTGAIYGNGTYFARDASYSDGGYARTLPTGQKQLLVVDVVTGVYCKGSGGMNTCPLLPGQKYARYNSLVNDVTDPVIFVVQHSGQAYPSYLITYH